MGTLPVFDQRIRLPNSGGLIALVEDRVDLHHIQGAHPIRIGWDLHQQLGLALARAVGAAAEQWHIAAYRAGLSLSRVARVQASMEADFPAAAEAVDNDP